jgi:CheY-like chemotaxis protein
MQGELREPLDDIADIVEKMREQAGENPELVARLVRIAGDVDSIRDRMRRVAEGPRALLGVERALSHTEKEPLIEGRRVLVADDEPAVRRVIADVLRNRGANVQVYDNGAEAIDALRNAAEQGQGFDLVISDIKMPDRNGYEVFSAARRALPDVPVILMTGFGYDPSHSIVRASQEGLQCVLFKPFQIERLLEETRSALERTEPDDAPDSSTDQTNHQTV